MMPLRGSMVAQAVGHFKAVRFHQGGKLVVFGTGAASTDALHVAVEFVHPVIVGKRALPAISLTTDVATLTGIAEAEGIDQVFAHQLRYLSDPADIERLGDQTMETYLNYFRRNYMGNRAPMHIGHHFYAYQHGIYDKVLLAFAKAVCSLPETRCVSYRELADFVDALDAASWSAYQRGDFSREELQEPAIDTARRSRLSEH